MVTLVLLSSKLKNCSTSLESQVIIYTHTHTYIKYTKFFASLHPHIHRNTENKQLT